MCTLTYRVNGTYIQFAFLLAYLKNSTHLLPREAYFNSMRLLLYFTQSHVTQDRQIVLYTLTIGRENLTSVKWYWTTSSWLPHTCLWVSQWLCHLILVLSWGTSSHQQLCQIWHEPSWDSIHCCICLELLPQVSVHCVYNAARFVCTGTWKMYCQVKQLPSM